MKNASLWAGWLPFCVLPLSVVTVRHRMPAWAFMWLLAIAVYVSLKWASWWRSPMREQATIGRSIGYVIAWPGMDAASFLDPGRRVQAPGGREWAWAFCKTALGGVLLWMVARRVPAQWPLLQGWVGLIGMVLLGHFGSFHLISLVWRRMGVDAQPIMAAPLTSASLSDFGDGDGISGFGSSAMNSFSNHCIAEWEPVAPGSWYLSHRG